MRFTKEKILAAIVALVGLITVGNLRVPQVGAVPQVPREEPARPYRAVSASPRLAPEKPYRAERDPFQAKDPWAEAEPALLAVPPAEPWPRALPGGLNARPRSPADRVLVRADPVRHVPGEEEPQ